MDFQRRGSEKHGFFKALLIGGPKTCLILSIFALLLIEKLVWNLWIKKPNAATATNLCGKETEK